MSNRICTYTPASPSPKKYIIRSFWLDWLATRKSRYKTRRFIHVSNVERVSQTTSDQLKTAETSQWDEKQLIAIYLTIFLITTISWKHKRAGNFNYLIDQGLSSLPEDQIPDEMHKPPHTLESNSVRQLQQQKWPGLEIAVPMSKLWTDRTTRNVNWKLAKANGN